MTLPFLFDVKFDTAIFRVRASHRNRRQIVGPRVGVLSHGRLADLEQDFTLATMSANSG
jgi:predicted methyltransferase MtxX (methanogen marker protein 4)